MLTVSVSDKEVKKKHSVGPKRKIFGSPNIKLLNLSFE